MANSADTRRILSYIFIGALAALFALEWGPGSKGCSGGELAERDVAATVNGKAIPLRDFAREYLQQVDRLRQQGVPSEMVKQFGLQKQVLDQMVSTELLAQAAEQKGLTASDDDLTRLYQKTPLFQKDGKFDHDTFLQYVREIENTTEVLFEDKLRRQLAAQRMIQLVESSVVVSDDEVKARYLKDGDAAKVAFVRFSPTMFAGQLGAPKPKELSDWLEANGQAVADFYEQNKFTYFLAEKVKARQILLKVPPDASPEVKAAVAQRAQGAKKTLDDKKDFAALAQELSEDLDTKAKGGELGWVERLQLPAAFADVLFALKPGEVSVPVETPLGYFIGTVEEKQAAEQRPLEAVRAEIARQLFVKERSKALARAAAEKALAEAKKGKALPELFPAEAKAAEGAFDFAQETKPAVKETPEFASTADAVPSLGAAPEAMKAIFARTQPGLLDTLVTVGDSVVILSVTERRLPSEETFAKDRADLRLQVEKGKQYEVRESFLKALRQTGTVITNDRSVERIVGS
jgi:peptidyl-prolyl cis-trans isomerase D